MQEKKTEKALDGVEKHEETSTSGRGGKEARQMVQKSYDLQCVTTLCLSSSSEKFSNSQTVGNKVGQGGGSKLGKRFCFVSALTGREEDSTCVGTEAPGHWKQEEIESKLQKRAESVRRVLDCRRRWNCGAV